MAKEISDKIDVCIMKNGCIYVGIRADINDTTIFLKEASLLGNGIIDINKRGYKKQIKKLYKNGERNNYPVPLNKLKNHIYL